MSLPLLALWILQGTVQAAVPGGSGSYERFQNYAAERRQSHAVVVASDLAGGLITAGTSLALAITATELIPKLGSTVTLTLGTAAAAHGILLLREGDEITRRADELRMLAEELN